MAQDVLSDLNWHSGFPIDKNIVSKKKIARAPVNADVLGRFIKANSDCQYLIHKTTKALWRFSKDGKSIEAVFDGDVIPQDEF